MELPLDEQQAMLQAVAARFCDERGGVRRVRTLRATGQVMDAEVWPEVAASGWLGVLVPEAVGGLGLGLTELALLAQEIGRHWLDVPLAPVALCAAALAQGPNGASRLPDEVLRGERIVVPVLDGDGTAFSPRGTPPRATPDGSGLRLDGTHRCVPFVEAAHSLLVMGEAPGAQPVLCVVDRHATGVTIAGTPCADGSVLSNVVFHATPVSAGAIVVCGPRATLLIDRIRSGLLIAASAELIGVGSTVLDLALDHVKLRHQFGKPIGSFQALQHRLVNGHIGLELAHALAFRVAADVDAGSAHPAMSPAVKARAGSAALDIARTALQVHGAMGYTDEHDIGQLFRRVLTLNAYYGNEAYQFSRFAQISAPRDALTILASRGA